MLIVFAVVVVVFLVIFARILTLVLVSSKSHIASHGQGPQRKHRGGCRRCCCRCIGRRQNSGWLALSFPFLGSSSCSCRRCRCRLAKLPHPRSHANTKFVHGNAKPPRGQVVSTFVYKNDDIHHSQGQCPRHESLLLWSRDKCHAEWCHGRAAHHGSMILLSSLLLTRKRRNQR